MLERPFGEIITFYSYKGGTGRSMALANVGYILATDPLYNSKKVLMVDWDLEAPGLHRFFSKDFRDALGVRSIGPESQKTLDQRLGLLDFLVEAKAFYEANSPSENLPESHATLPRAQEMFDRVVTKTGFDKLPLKVDGIPNLLLLKAGRQDSKQEYGEKLRKFDWEAFYRQYGSFYTHFRAYLMKTFDFVLIDSRTGLTDVSDICTKVMPEKLVAVFVPNNQNLEGLEWVVRKAARYRGDSRDPRGLIVFPLASRIDGSNSVLREAWWHGGNIAGEDIVGYQKIFEKSLSEVYDLDECHLHEYFDATQVPYDAHYAFGERVAARQGTSDKLSIGSACASLAKRLVQLSAPWEVLDTAELAAEAKRKAEEAAFAAKETVALWKRVIAIASLVLVLGFAGWQSWLAFTPSGRQYQHNQELAKLPVIDVTFEGPWASVPDPSNHNSVLLIAPRTTAYRNLIVAASNDATLGPGSYDLSTPPPRGDPAGAYDAGIFRTSVNATSVSRVLGTKGDRWMIRLPVPERYTASSRSTSRIGATYPPAAATQANYATGVSLRYHVSNFNGFSVSGTPDNGRLTPLLLRVETPIIRFSVTGAGMDDDCNTRAREAFHGLVQLLGLTLFVDFPDDPSVCHARDPQMGYPAGKSNEISLQSRSPAQRWPAPIIGSK